MRLIRLLCVVEYNSLESKDDILLHDVIPLFLYFLGLKLNIVEGNLAVTHYSMGFRVYYCTGENILFAPCPSKSSRKLSTCRQNTRSGAVSEESCNQHADRFLQTLMLRSIPYFFRISIVDNCLVQPMTQAA